MLNPLLNPTLAAAPAEPAISPEDEQDDYSRRFAGIGRLYGTDALTRFEQAHVLVIGIGGVGSWAAEALARSAVGRLSLMDMDVLVASNINRQLPALSSTLGMDKIQAMAQRLREINPRIQLTLLDDMLSADNVAQVLSDPPNVVLDCMDDVKAKLALMLHCRFHKIPLIVAGGAGGKHDPLKLRCADLSQTEYDPMLAKLRRTLRKDYGIGRKSGEKMGIPCVYSVEQPWQPDNCTVGGLQCGGYGSATAVTASFGMALASEALKRLAKSP